MTNYKITLEDLKKLCPYYGKDEIPPEECDCPHCDVILNCGKEGGVL